MVVLIVNVIGRCETQREGNHVQLGVAMVPVNTRRRKNDDWHLNSQSSAMVCRSRCDPIRPIFHRSWLAFARFSDAFPEHGQV